MPFASVPSAMYVLADVVENTVISLAKHLPSKAIMILSPQPLLIMLSVYWATDMPVDPETIAAKWIWSGVAREKAILLSSKTVGLNPKSCSVNKPPDTQAWKRQCPSAGVFLSKHAPSSLAVRASCNSWTLVAVACPLDWDTYRLTTAAAFRSYNKASGFCHHLADDTLIWDAPPLIGS